MSMIPPFTQRPASSVGGGDSNKPVLSPWMDYASTTVPDSHELVLWWAQYLWMMDGNYRTALERVAAHFMTILEFPDLEPDEESEWRDFFSNNLNYRRELLAAAHDYLCFQGDTRAVTRDGVFKLRDLAGKTVDVLSQDGVFRRAEFKSFGRQSLLEVEFSDGRTVLATPEHQWIVKESPSGTVKIPTTQLKGRRVPHVVAPRPLRGAAFREGVRHGFVFGDGSLYDSGSAGLFSVANFYDGKEELLPFFEGHGSAPAQPTASGDKPLLYTVRGLPARYRALPVADESAEHWYGFVCGLLSACGQVSTSGGIVLAYTDASALAAVAEQLPRIGMVAGKLQRVESSSPILGCEGDCVTGRHTLWRLSLQQPFVQPEDLLLTKHRACFRAKPEACGYDKSSVVTDVRETGIVDDVFCCVEPQTHSFVIENGVLTGNCYGNLFVGLYLPFKRFVQCQGCGMEHPIDKVDYDLDFTDRDPYLVWRRKTKCTCGNAQPYSVIDRRSSDLSKVKLNRYSPLEIELAFNRYSQSKNIYWNIPDDDRKDIQNKARIHIDETPIEVLQTVASGGKLHFNSALILHVDEPCISGVRTRGWGIPRTIANFRSAWLQQLTCKADQAVMLDYTLGMRFISPAPTPGGTDPMMVRGMQEFVENIKSTVAAHRLNPTSFHASPYPLQYNFMGGEGAALIPPDKLKFRQAEFLNQLGVPLEYHQMNLSAQAAPMALRLFEAYWQQIPAFYNRVLDWVVSTLSKSFNLASTKVVMQKTTVVDDANYKAMLLQLMSGNQLSPQTALEPMGINAHDEVRKVYKHQDFVARVQAEFDEKAKKREEMAAFKQNVTQPNAAMAGQPGGGQPPPGTPQGGVPQGGMPGAIGQNTPQSLAEISEQATGMAQQLVSLPEFERKQQLKMLREGNKELHSLVTSEMEKIRRSAASQGQQMLLQGGGGQPPA